MKNVLTIKEVRLLKFEKLDGLALARIVAQLIANFDSPEVTVCIKEDWVGAGPNESKTHVVVLECREKGARP